MSTSTVETTTTSTKPTTDEITNDDLLEFATTIRAFEQLHFLLKSEGTDFDQIKLFFKSEKKTPSEYAEMITSQPARSEYEQNYLFKVMPIVRLLQKEGMTQNEELINSFQEEAATLDGALHSLALCLGQAATLPPKYLTQVPSLKIFLTKIHKVFCMIFDMYDGINQKKLDKEFEELKQKIEENAKALKLESDPTDGFPNETILRNFPLAVYPVPKNAKDYENPKSMDEIYEKLMNQAKNVEEEVLAPKQEEVKEEESADKYEGAGRQKCFCSKTFDKGALVRKLTCGHYFHVKCVNCWLEAHASCPVCGIKFDKKQIMQNQNVPQCMNQ